MKIGKIILDYEDTRKIKRFFIGFQPFFVVWFIFWLFHRFDGFSSFNWWTIPLAGTGVGWFIYAICICGNEFDWE